MSYYVEQSGTEREIEPLTHDLDSTVEFLNDPEARGLETATGVDRADTLVCFLYDGDGAGPDLCLVTGATEGDDGGDVTVSLGGLPVDGDWIVRRAAQTTVGERELAGPNELPDGDPFYQTVTWQWYADGSNAGYFDGDLSRNFDITLLLDDASGVSSLVVIGGDADDPTVHELALEESFQIGASQPSTVQANVTTLSYIPGGNENSTSGGSAFASGLSHFFPESDVMVRLGILDIPIESYDFLIHRDFGGDDPIGFARVSTRPIFDNFATGDMIPIDEGLPERLGTRGQAGTALDRVTGKYEELPDDVSINKYRGRNEVNVHFETDGESVDRESLRIDHTLESTNSVFEQEDANTMPRDWLEFEDTGETQSNYLPSLKKTPNYDYEIVTVDGVEGVRVSVIGAVSTQYAEALAENASTDPFGTLSTLFEWPRELENLTDVADTVKDFFLDSIPFLDRGSNIFTYYETVVLADGRKLVKLWDHSMFPHHQLYVGDDDGTSRKRFETELDIERQELVNPYLTLFAGEAVAGVTPYHADSATEYLTSYVQNNEHYDAVTEPVEAFLESALVGELDVELPDPGAVLPVLHNHPITHVGVDADGTELDDGWVASVFDDLDGDSINPFDRRLLPRTVERWEAGELRDVHLRHAEPWEAGPSPSLERQHLERWEAGPLDGIELRLTEQWEADGLDSVERRHLERWEPSDPETVAPPSDLAVTNRTSSSVDLAWEPPASDETTVASYVVSVDGDDVQTVASSETTTTVDDLDGGQTYTVGVRVVDADENESNAITVEATTVGETYSVRATSIEEPVYENGFVDSSVVLEGAPSGLGSLSFTVTVGDESVATIDGASPGPAIEDASTVSVDGPTAATLEASDLDVAAGASDVELLSVTLATESEGALELAIDDATATTASGGSVEVTASGVDSTVEAVFEREDGSEPHDTNGDGLYRDVTGDGSVTNSDVTEFFANQHTDPWDSRPDLFDFTGDDEVSQADVIELFRYVVE